MSALKTIEGNINQEFVDDLYNPVSSGIKILKGEISNSKLEKMNSFIKENFSSFEEKREKYIQNNQLVSLLYRGPFDFSEMENTIFKEIVEEYIKIRECVGKFSEKKFKKGTSLEIKLIYYPISELGVGIHKDLSSNINLIIFFNLEGSTDIKTYSDKEGDNPIAHPIKMGDISIMRGPRDESEFEKELRPYHAIEKVLIPRTVLVIREINEELEKLTNKDNWRGF